MNNYRYLILSLVKQWLLIFLFRKSLIFLPKASHMFVGKMSWGIFLILWMMMQLFSKKCTTSFIINCALTAYHEIDPSSQRKSMFQIWFIFNNIKMYFKFLML